MDIRASTPELMNLQTKLRSFYEMAAECNNHCVKKYDQKNLNTDEQDCVFTCYNKQQRILESLNAKLK